MGACGNTSLCTSLKNFLNSCVVFCSARERHQQLRRKTCNKILIKAAAKIGFQAHLQQRRFGILVTVSFASTTLLYQGRVQGERARPYYTPSILWPRPHRINPGYSLVSAVGLYCGLLHRAEDNEYEVITHKLTKQDHYSAKKTQQTIFEPFLKYCIFWCIYWCICTFRVYNA